MTLHRTPANPTTWAAALGLPQGELVSGASRTLYVSGQTSMSDDGRPLHDGDLAAQLARGLDNLEAVLSDAGMTLAHLVRLDVVATDVEALLVHHDVLVARLRAACAAPTTTMLGVTRLAVPGQLVELTAVAVD